MLVAYTCGMPKRVEATMSKRAPLDSWGMQALEHWKEHRPRMYAELEAAGRLREAAVEAQERTKVEMGQLMDEAGMNWQEACEATREKNVTRQYNCHLKRKIIDMVYFLQCEKDFSFIRRCRSPKSSALPDSGNSTIIPS